MASSWQLTHTLSHPATVNVATLNHGGQYLLTAGSDRLIRLWNVQKGTLVKEYAGHGYEVLGITVAPDNSRLGSCGGDRNVLYWDVASGTIVKRWSGHLSTVNCVAFSFDGNVLASGGFDGTVRLWDCKSQQRMPIQVLDEAKDSITSITIRGSDILTSSVDGHVRSYDLRKGKLSADYFEKPVTSLHLLSDGLTFLSSSLASPIRLIDRSTGELLQSYSGHKNVDYKSKVCCGYGERTVIAGDEEGKVHVWDLESGKPVEAIQAHKKLVTWVEHHPTADGPLVTAGADSTAKVWSRTAPTGAP